MNLASDSVMTIISDAFAILLCMGLLTLSDRNRERRNYEDKCFYNLCLVILLTAIADTAAYLLGMGDFVDLRFVVLLLYTAEQMLMVCGIWLWMTYIDYQIYKKPDHIKRKYRPLLIPAAIIGVLLLINMFTGFMFGVDENLVLCYEPGYYPLILVETVGFLYPGYEIYRYSKRSRTVYFMRAWPVLLPVLIDIFISSATLYSVTALSFSSSLTFLYFYMMNRWRFVDPKTGFYNIAYLDFLKRQKREGKKDYKFILAFSSPDDPGDELCGSLKDNAPTGSDIIRESDGKFLLCTDVSNRLLLSDLGDFIISGIDENEISFDILNFDSYNTMK